MSGQRDPFPVGQEHHCSQSAQGHHGQGQDQVPQPPGQGSHFLGEMAAEQKEQQPKHRRSRHSGQHSVCVKEIGVQQGGDRHDQREENEGHRQPAHAVPFAVHKQ